MKCPGCEIDLPEIAGACFSCGAIIPAREPAPTLRAPEPVGDVPPSRAGPAAYMADAGTPSGYGVAPSTVAPTPGADVGRVLPSNRERFAPSVGAPGAAASDSIDSPAAEAIELTVGSMYLSAFRAVGRSLGVLVVGGIVAFVADIAVSWSVGRALGLLGQGDQSPTGTFANAATFLLVGAPLSVGWQYLCLRAIRHASPAVADVFAPYRGRLFDTAMASVVQGILVALAAVPLFVGFAAVVLLGVIPASAQTIPDVEAAVVALPVGTQLGLAVGTLVALIPPLVVAARLSFMPYVVIDERQGPLVAASESWSRTRGVSRTVIGVVLSGAMLALVGILAFVVGALVGMLLFSLAHAATFETVTTRAARNRIARRSIDVYG